MASQTLFLDYYLSAITLILSLGQVCAWVTQGCCFFPVRRNMLLTLKERSNLELGCVLLLFWEDLTENSYVFKYLL